MVMLLLDTQLWHFGLFHIYFWNDCFASTEQKSMNEWTAYFAFSYFRVNADGEIVLESSVKHNTTNELTNITKPFFEQWVTYNPSPGSYTHRLAQHNGGNQVEKLCRDIL